MGSTANFGGALTVINAAVTGLLVLFKKELDELMAGGKSFENATIELLKKYIRLSIPIHFDGNGYSNEWKEEAATRGSDCESAVPLLFDRLISVAAIVLFRSPGISNVSRTHARTEIISEL